MTVGELSKKPNFTALNIAEPERNIDGVYIGDLLSWVMGRAKESDAWITIMSNVNTAAVASLADVSCIILAEDVTLEEDVLKVVKEKQINVILSCLPIYETAVNLSKML